MLELACDRRWAEELDASVFMIHPPRRPLDSAKEIADMACMSALVGRSIGVGAGARDFRFCRFAPLTGGERRSADLSGWSFELTGVMTRIGEGGGCLILGICDDADTSGEAGGSSTSESFGVGVGGGCTTGEPMTGVRSARLLHGLQRG